MYNKNGFYRPTYDEIVESKEAKAKELFGEDIDTGELTALGKFIRINAYDLSKAYEDLEATYYARFPNTAVGTALDRLCVFAGIVRNPPTYATHKIRVFGEQNYTVEMGALIVRGKDSDISFYNIDSYTINQSMTVNDETVYYTDAIVQCATSGTAGNIPIEEIVNTITEVDRIEYLGVDESGKESETDLDLRKRFAKTIEGAGSNNASALRAVLMRINNVTSAEIAENDEDTWEKIITADTTYQAGTSYYSLSGTTYKLLVAGTDYTVGSAITTTVYVDGRPPHSFECYVNGGDEDEIAQAIFEKKPIGIKSCSTATGDDKVEKTVKDAGGNEHTIFFSKVSRVNLKLKISYKKDATFNSNATDSENGLTEIRTNLVNYINGLGIGTDVILSKLYEYIYDVQGVTEVTNLTISTNGGTTYTTSNVTIQKWQIAHLSADDIDLQEVQS